MTTLIVGASGKTGKCLVEQLLNMSQKVKVIIRKSAKIPETWVNNKNVLTINSDISEISVNDMANYLSDCRAVACCLGHNVTLKGIYGKPRKLVTNAVILVCDAAKKISPEKPIKFVLMNTTANRNKDLKEPVSTGQKIIIGLIRLLLPPQSDNEKAAEFLRFNIGQNNKIIEWVIVRPDTLINRENVSEYDIFPSPVRNPVFNPGETSRINTGNFMAKLITDSGLMNKWKGQMPVIYNKSD